MPGEERDVRPIGLGREFVLSGKRSRNGPGIPLAGAVRQALEPAHLSVWVSHRN